MSVICFGRHCGRPYFIHDDNEDPMVWDSIEEAQEQLQDHMLINASEDVYYFDLDTGEYA